MLMILDAYLASVVVLARKSYKDGKLGLIQATAVIRYTSIQVEEELSVAAIVKYLM
jgi:hypothetical protein